MWEGDKELSWKPSVKPFIMKMCIVDIIRGFDDLYGLSRKELGSAGLAGELF